MSPPSPPDGSGSSRSLGENIRPARPRRRPYLHRGRYPDLSRKLVETPVARALIAGDARDGAVIQVGLTDGKLAISYDNPA